MPTFDLNGTRLHYGERGGGRAVVLIHGFPVNSRMWDAQVKSLAEGYRVITPDLRGFGQSKSAEAFTMESLAEDVHGLLAGIGALPCVLGGLSMGGYVALAFVRKYMSDLTGLMLLDTKAEGDAEAVRENRMKMVELVRAKGAGAVAEQMIPRVLAEGTLAERPALVQRLRGMMEGCSALTIEHASLAMRDRRDQTDLLASIAVPTLVVVGQHDLGTPPEVMEGMHRAIPRSVMSVIAGAGHFSPMEQPRMVNRAMKGFLAASSQ